MEVDYFDRSYGAIRKAILRMLRTSYVHCYPNYENVVPGPDHQDVCERLDLLVDRNSPWYHDNYWCSDLHDVLSVAINRKRPLTWKLLFQKMLTLRLIDNQIPEMDNFLTHFQCLQLLSLADNGLDKVPGRYLPHQTLRVLNLSGNNITDLSLLLDCSFPHLLLLDLSGNNLKDDSGFDQVARNAPGLQLLDLTHNDVIGTRNLLQSLKHCTRVKNLHLEGNPCSYSWCYVYDVMTTLPNLLSLDGSGAIRPFPVPTPSEELEVILPDPDTKGVFQLKVDRVMGHGSQPKEIKNCEILFYVELISLEEAREEEEARKLQASASKKKPVNTKGKNKPLDTSQSKSGGGNKKAGGSIQEEPVVSGNKGEDNQTEEGQQQSQDEPIVPKKFRIQTEHIAWQQNNMQFPSTVEFEFEDLAKMRHILEDGIEARFCKEVVKFATDDGDSKDSKDIADGKDAAKKAKPKPKGKGKEPELEKVVVSVDVLARFQLPNLKNLSWKSSPMQFFWSKAGGGKEARIYPGMLGELTYDESKAIAAAVKVAKEAAMAAEKAKQKDDAKPPPKGKAPAAGPKDKKNAGRIQTLFPRPYPNSLTCHLQLGLQSMWEKLPEIVVDKKGKKSKK